jgi:DNA repair protein RAD50
MAELASTVFYVIDFQMLNLLGVPKAILEYVLFCHQDDINWPLSEPKELKMRFDAIFEVTKFVKALDNVKKNIKELVSERTTK